MGLTTIQALSHSAENVLGMIRSKELIPTPEIVNVLLQSSDQLRDMIQNVQNSNEVDISSNLTSLDAIADGTFSEAAPEEPAAEESAPAAPPSSPAPPGLKAVETEAEPAAAPTPAPEPKPAPAPKPAPEPKAAAQKTAPTADENKNHNQKPTTEATLRVHVSLLDSLMTLAGELVLSRNQLLQTISSTDGMRNAEAAGQ